MKKLILIMCILFVGLSGYCFAEKKEVDFQNAVTMNPLGMVLGLANVQYQYKIKDDASLSLRGTYWGFSLSSWKWSSFGIGGAYRFNISKRGLAGFYVGPNAGVTFISAEYSGSSATSILLTPGGEFGYQWIWDGFTLDLTTGLTYYIGKLTVANTDFPYGGLGWSGLGVGLGWAW